MKTVIKRLVFYIQIQLESPLNVASGEDEWTDADILLDFDGNPFVPGSSLAGAMRSYIGEKDNEWELFGFSKGAVSHFHTRYRGKNEPASYLISCISPGACDRCARWSRVK